jgi:predicted nucleic acid-binding protein
VDIADLLDADVYALRNRLGLGEISTLAFSRKTRQAMLTDDQKARKRIREVMPNHPVQTTPHLLSWLSYLGRITPVEKETILNDHRRNGGQIVYHLERGFEIGVEARDKQDARVSTTEVG